MPLSLLQRLQKPLVESIKLVVPDWTIGLAPVLKWLSSPSSFPKLQELDLSGVSSLKEWFECLGTLSEDAATRFPSLRVFCPPQLNRMFGNTPDARAVDLARLRSFCRALPALKKIRLASPSILRDFPPPFNMAGFATLAEKLFDLFGLPLSALSTSTGSLLWEEVHVSYQLRDVALSQQIFTSCYQRDLEGLAALSRFVETPSISLDRHAGGLLSSYLALVEPMVAKHAELYRFWTMDRKQLVILKLLSRLLALARLPDHALVYMQQRQSRSGDQRPIRTTFMNDSICARIGALFATIVGDWTIPSLIEEMFAYVGTEFNPVGDLIHLAAIFSPQSLISAVLGSQKALQLLKHASARELYFFACAPEFRSFAQAHSGAGNFTDPALFVSLRRMWMSLISHADGRSDVVLPLLAHFVAPEECKFEKFPPEHAVMFLFNSKERAILVAKTFRNASLIVSQPELEARFQSWASSSRTAPARGAPHSSVLRSIVAFTEDLQIMAPAAVVELLSKVDSRPARDQ